MIQVSIIIPMYNVAHFLHSCIQSVLDQNMFDKNFEVLMIDDGSPDNSKSVAKELSQKHTFVKVFSQENKGLGGARNTGIENAKGKYLLFLDADDVLIPKTLLSLIELAENNDLDVLEFGADQIDESGKVIATVAISSNEAVFNGIEYYNNVKYMNSACNKLYSREFLVNNNLLFAEKIYGEDFEFNTRSFFFAKRILATSKLGASFLQSSNSITRNKDINKKNKYVRDFILILENLSDFKDKNVDINNIIKFEYLEGRLSTCNLFLFYFLFKNNYSFKEIESVRRELKGKGLYRDSHKFYRKDHEYFRKVLLRNFYLFRITQPLKQVLGY